jgi:hypothetical protein
VVLQKITGSQKFRFIIDSDYAHVVSLRALDPPERGKIICKVSSIDLEAGDWLIVYPPPPQNKD